jgi:hypothetical protein
LINFKKERNNKMNECCKNVTTKFCPECGSKPARRTVLGNEMKIKIYKLLEYRHTTAISWTMRFKRHRYYFRIFGVSWNWYKDVYFGN